MRIWITVEKYENIIYYTIRNKILWKSKTNLGDINDSNRRL